MRNLIYTINVSLDGVCDHTKMSGGEDILDFYANLLRDSGPLVYGRITYQLMVPYWPDVLNDPTARKAEIEFARVFDAAEKIVFSQSLDKVEDKHSRLARTKPEDEILRLKQQPGKNIFLGGVALASYLVERGLVDEYLFVVHPIIAGEGRRLLDGVSRQDNLKLVDTKVFKSGFVALHYLKQPA